MCIYMCVRLCVRLYICIWLSGLLEMHSAVDVRYMPAETHVRVSMYVCAFMCVFIYMHMAQGGC
jgi:hypothetical protein